jgi:hypothetical protein
MNKVKNNRWNSCVLLNVMDDGSRQWAIPFIWLELLDHREAIRGNYHLVIWDIWDETDNMPKSNCLYKFRILVLLHPCLEATRKSPLWSLITNPIHILSASTNKAASNIHLHPSSRRRSPLFRFSKVTPFGINRFVKMWQNHFSVYLYFLCNTLRMHPEITISDIIFGLPNVPYSDR